MNKNIIKDNTLLFIETETVLFVNTIVCLRLKAREFLQLRKGHWLISVSIVLCQIFRLLVSSSKIKIKCNKSLMSKSLVNIFWKIHAHLRLTV
jgi:hypothetical protein